MISNVQQNGQSFELQLTMDCHNPKCLGEYELVTSFSNDQELWQCNKCKDRYFAWVAEARYTFASIKAANLAAAGESDMMKAMYSAEHMSEAISKNCIWCRHDFATFDVNDELCESCSITDRIGWTN